MRALVISLAVLLMVSASAQAVVLADFEAAGTADTMQSQDRYFTYGDLASQNGVTNWTSFRSNAATTPTWDISGGKLYNNLNANQSNNVAIAVWEVDLSTPTDGMVWAVQFDLDDGGRVEPVYNNGLQDLDIMVAELDTTGPVATDNLVYAANQGGFSGQADTVTAAGWNTVFADGWIYEHAADNTVITVRLHDDYSGGGAQGNLVDLSNNDLLALQIKSNSVGGNATVVDNFELVEVVPLGDYDSDNDVDITDIDALTAVGDLTVGIDVTGTADEPKDITGTRYDRDPTAVPQESSYVSGNDLNAILYWAARSASTYGGGGTAYYTAYKATDSDLNRTVDINDTLNLIANFDGGVSTTKVFSQGDSDGSGSIDINDVLALVADFDGGVGYLDDGAAAEAFAPMAGELELVVDETTGTVKIVANGGSIAAFQITSVGGSLIAADATPDVLSLILGNSTQTYGEMAFANTAVDGEYNLDLGYNTTLNLKDIDFSYGASGTTATIGTVTYVPEPATMALLGLGGLVMIRRRRTA